jgi:heterodisulfide reductase subunit A
VITAMEMERLLSASGPTGGHLVRPSDHKEPKKIAWFQCVGSRDLNRCDNSYCSSVCCMYAIKEAVIAKEHAGDDLDCAIFFMDMRTHGKDFERFYNNAQDKHGVRFVRSRFTPSIRCGIADDLSMRYVTETGDLGGGKFDMIVLSVGMQTPLSWSLWPKTGHRSDRRQFLQDRYLQPVETSRPGIFVCGAFQGPKIFPSRWWTPVPPRPPPVKSLQGPQHPPPKNRQRYLKPTSPANAPDRCVRLPLRHQYRRRGGCALGGRICRHPALCGICDRQSLLLLPGHPGGHGQIIKQKKLNRVVVAACTPKTHEPLFQETLINAGLNKYLFEMANIRNHDSWVHKNNPELATEKAKDLVRMAVTKVALMQPLKEAELEVNQRPWSSAAASPVWRPRSLALQGYKTHIVERGERLGGQAHNLYKTISGDLIKDKLADMVADVETIDNIEVHLETELTEVQGFVGNFTSALTTNGNQQEIKHGISVIATGGSPFQPTEYEYGKDPRIMTSLELDKRFMADDPELAAAETAVFIQCVGSREPDRPYCSRVCCTHSIDSALELKKRNPDMSIYILCRGIRTYGEREYVYREAREQGVIFIRFEVDSKPQVELVDGKVRITVIDHVLGLPVQMDADLLTLATAIVPNRDEKLANFFKVPLNEDGFFVEKHAKLGPSEFATDGVFLCGMAHYPKPIDEAIVQGRAAASRAVTLLARKTIHTSGEVAEIDPMVCSSCGVCVSICPYSAPSFIEADARMFAGKAQINPVLCKGCGLCVASCRSGAIHLHGFDNNQIFGQIFSINEAS